MIVHELFNLDEPGVKPVYYISDVHLCHQLQTSVKTELEIEAELDEKVKHLVESISTKSATIVVAGDVADSVEVAHMFYRSLTNELKTKGLSWRVLAILGNHELWDGDPGGTKQIRSIAEIVESYREALVEERVALLQNELLIDYKRTSPRVIRERDLLEADEDELREVLAEATLIILGGIGFSALNPRFNAVAGIYGMKPGPNCMTMPRLSREEEAEQSRRFCSLYSKVLRCAANRQVIVLTHMPMSDWSHMPYNRKWVYISGHTHQNCLIRDDDGTTVLSDNQIGYSPKPWHFNAFTYRGSYDPFEQWGDGIFDISAGQYIDFNNGRGIGMAGFKRAGQIRMIKRSGVYMFFLQSKNLSILAGGTRTLASHGIEYYYENMPFYQRCVKEAFGPYHNALNLLSKEIKSFGGLGRIHGCIVDIDWSNHIYLNPFDGKIAPYFAWDMTNKFVFDDVFSLLVQSPYPPRLPNGAPMLDSYKIAKSEGKLPLLSKYANGESAALAIVPEPVLDRSMYEPSRIMRSVQYVFDQDVVRIWNDAVFGNNVPVDKGLPGLGGKAHRSRPRKDLAEEAKPVPLTPEQKLRKRSIRYVEKVRERSSGQVAVDADSYTGGRDRVTAECLTCGHIWALRADKLLERCYCPNCHKKHAQPS